MPRLTRRPPEASKRRPRGPARTAHQPLFSQDETPLVVPHQKHALIRAHADARVKARTGWGIGYYIGVAASCLVVVSGWWLTLDQNIRSNIDPGRDPLVQVLDEGAEGLRQNVEQAAQGPNGMHAMQVSVERLREEYERARIQAEAEAVAATRSSATSSLSHPTSTSTN